MENRLIDGSKSCSRLLEDHLQRHWCATAMNLFTDRRGRVCGFLHGDFLSEFKFRQEDDAFLTYTCVYHPREHGEVEDLELKLQTARDIIPDDSLKIKECEGGAIVLVQKISAATLLVDEEINQTLETFFDIAKSARKITAPKRKRRMSWFARHDRPTPGAQTA